HANWLEAEHVGELRELIKRRGYRFITLENALGDDAYGLPDTWVGEEGRGWIEHWAITRGQPPLNAPVFPADILARIDALPKALRPVSLDYPPLWRRFSFSSSLLPSSSAFFQPPLRLPDGRQASAVSFSSLSLKGTRARKPPQRLCLSLS